MEKNNLKYRDCRSISLSIGNLINHILMWGIIYEAVIEWNQIPDNLASYFAGGTVDSTGGKEALFLLLGLSVLLYVINFVTMYACPRYVKKSYIFFRNADRFADVKDCMRGMNIHLRRIAWMDVILLLTMGYVLFTTTAVRTLGIGSVMVFVVLLVGEFAYFMWLTDKFSREVLRMNGKSEAQETEQELGQQSEQEADFTTDCIAKDQKSDSESTDRIS